MFEFISLEHTSKNRMILAVRRPGAPAAREDALRRVAEARGMAQVADNLGRGLGQRNRLRLLPAHRVMMGGSGGSRGVRTSDRLGRYLGDCPRGPP